MWVCGLDINSSEWGHTAGCTNSLIMCSYAVTDGKCLESLSDYQFIMKHSATEVTKHRITLLWYLNYESQKVGRVIISKWIFSGLFRAWRTQGNSVNGCKSRVLLVVQESVTIKYCSGCGDSLPCLQTAWFCTFFSATFYNTWITFILSVRVICEC